MVPFFQRVEKLEIRPRIFIMEGEVDDPADHDKVRKLTVRAKDGSNFYFDKVTIAYAVIPGKAPEVIENTGLDPKAIAFAVKIHSREVLRNEFGRYSFEEIADPSTYGETSKLTEPVDAGLKTATDPVSGEYVTVMRSPGTSRFTTS